MNKKVILSALLMLSATGLAHAQWTNWDTQTTIRGVFGAANALIESSERKKQMEIEAQQKVQFEQSFKDKMAEAKELEGFEQWEDALDKYEDAASLNCKYGYVDQRNLSNKITSLYKKAGREEPGPSILNNDKVTLSDYSGYRYMKENPIYTSKKDGTGRIIRVACSATETRIEMECETLKANASASIPGSTYIKGNKGGKLELTSVENITVSPGSTAMPWPHQKLRFALIFPPLPADATEFDFVAPKTVWMFKDIKCR